jgi:hypothetical protein
MNNFYEALEYCLQALEDGADLNAVLARYPDLAEELRPILEASIAARNMAVDGPSTEAMRRGRAKLLRRAAELREMRAPAPRRVIPIFQRLSLALTIAAVFLLSGTGLVRASSTALPGENLYPVKRTWEGMRLWFVFDANLRDALRSEYENERLEEVGELLSEGRHETIQFAGVVMDVNGVTHVSGIRIVILDTTALPVGGLPNGAAVIVTGRTNAEGFVEDASIELLPPGSVVPVGNPVKVETENAESPQSGQGAGTGSTSGDEAGGSDSNNEVQNFQVEGRVDAVSDGTLVIDGQTVYLDQPEIEGVIIVGKQVKVEGYFAEDGRFIVTKIEVEGFESDGKDGSGSSGSNDSGGNDHSNDNSNSNDDSNSNEEEENHNEGGGGNENEDH